MQRHELLKHYQKDADCVFYLRLAFGAGSHQDEVEFSEYFDYVPRPGDGGREYAYSVLVPERDLNRMVEVFARHCSHPAGGEPRADLLDCCQSLIASGVLGAHLGLRENVGVVRSWLDEAGIGYRMDQWAWMDSD